MKRKFQKKINSTKMAIIGLGYVGLPLAIEFAKIMPVVGFDLNRKRVAELKSGHDRNLEMSFDEIFNAKKLNFTSAKSELANANCFVITVPTPINEYKQPDLSALTSACVLVGEFIKTDSIIIFESTVFPGATEEICVPILEEKSGLQFNEDFFCGYSPERINPGDKEHRLVNIKKVTSGSTLEVANFVDSLYRKIIKAGTHRAESIKVAEAAKVIENTQRDINIALINELAIIFNKLEIDTEDVLRAAGSKWNFLNFRPGLVGGHCIGVDPYYLTHKSQAVGYNPEIILAGRRLNDGMANYVASQFVKALMSKKIEVFGAKILILGLTFKENCPDLRNTKIVDILAELEEYHCSVDIYDPWVQKEEARREYGIDIISEPIEHSYDGIIIAVAHDEFKNLNVSQIKELTKLNSVVYDLKYMLNREDSDLRL